MAKHTLQIMDRKGHTSFEWDTDDDTSVVKAAEAFVQAQERRMTMYALHSATEGEVIKNFNPSVDIVAALPLVGG